MLMAIEKKKVYVDDDSQNAYEILERCKEIQIVDSIRSADLLWIMDYYRDFYDYLRPFQLLNHIRGESYISLKGELAATLKEYDQHHPSPYFSSKEFHQESYLLYDKKEREDFLKQLPSQDIKNNLWIMKPSGLCSGIGMKVLWQFDELREELQDSSKMTLAFKGDDPDYNGTQIEYIIQRYIQNVLLLNGRKSEIRIYWTIACIDPLIVLMFPVGTVRLTLQKFQLDDFDNPLVHVTNIYQQEQHAAKGESLDELKWDFDRLEKYAHEELRIAPANWIENQLKPKIRNILEHVARAVKFYLVKDKVKRGLNFGIYGADFILDDKLNPWLSEVQKSPGLSFDDPIKEKIIPPMLEEGILIALEVQKKLMQNQPLNNFESVKEYEWVINEAVELSVSKNAHIT